MIINIRNSYIVIVLILVFFSCESGKKENIANETVEDVSSGLQVDHCNVWVEDPQKAKQKLIDIGFLAVPDSLSIIHKGQGTSGRFFYFLNGYLELLFVYDQNEFETNNKMNSKLDFAERRNFKNNGVSPFSLALRLEDYDREKIPFQTVEYRQGWMSEGSSIYSAKNSKLNLKEPSIFVVYPEIESDRFETFSDLEKIPEEYALWRTFFKHPNGAKKITAIKITSIKMDVNTETIKAVNGIDNVEVKNGTEHLMELYFDHNAQGKSFDLRPELPLMIYL